MAGKVEADVRTLHVVRGSLRTVAGGILDGSDFFTEWQAAPDEALLGQGPPLAVPGPTAPLVGGAP